VPATKDCMVILVHALVAPVNLLLKRTKSTTKAVPSGLATCAVNLTEVGSQTPALKNSVLDVNTLTNPFISTGGVEVLGVNKARGVNDETVGVKSSVGVTVLCPLSVGVTVYVDVAMVAVKVGTSVGVIVFVEAGVGVCVGIKKTWSNVMEQEENRNAHKRKMPVFFI